MWATAAFPSTLAAIGTVPTYRPVTTPVGETVAKLESALAHNTLRPVTTLPVASSADAVSVTVAPTTTVAVGGATSTAVTTPLMGSSLSPPHATPATAAIAVTTRDIHVGRGLLIRNGLLLQKSNPSIQECGESVASIIASKNEDCHTHRRIALPRIRADTTCHMCAAHQQSASGRKWV